MKTTKSPKRQTGRFVFLAINLIGIFLLSVGIKSSTAQQGAPLTFQLSTVDAAGTAKTSFYLGESVSAKLAVTNTSGTPQTITTLDQAAISLKLSSRINGEEGPVVRDAFRGGRFGSSSAHGVELLLEGTPTDTTLAPGQRVEVLVNIASTFGIRLDDGSYTLSAVYSPTLQAQVDFTIAIDEPRTVPVLEQMAANGNESDQRWANSYLDLIRKPSISGRVTNSSGAGVGGVRFNVTGAATTNLSNLSDGTYRLTQLTSGGNYTLTPVLEGYTFEPASRAFSNLTVKQVNINFTATKTMTGENVALGSAGAVVTASSTLDDDYPADSVINGFTNGDWGTGSGGWQDGTPGVFPDSIEINFGSPKAIDWINVYTLQDNFENSTEPTLTDTFSLYGITDFDVQYWDGNTFVNVPGGQVNGNNKVWRQFTFPTITTSRIQVVVRNGLAGQSRITEIQAFHANKPPTVSIPGTYQAAPGATIQFASTAADSDGSIQSYAWDFGDSTSGTGANPTHAYATAGSYTVSLTVTDDGGLTATATKTVSIAGPPQAPVASAGGPYSGFAGTSLVFDGRASVDPDGSIVSYQWTFGDGGTATGSAPSHTYAQVGNYNVTLLVTDNSGLTASQTTTASITVPAPVVTMTAPSSGAVVAANSTVRLIASVSSADPISSVQFFQGSTLLGNGTLVTPATTPPTYFFDWANVPAGSYSVTAKATKTNGIVGTSAPVNLTVSGPPTVSITAPANNATFATGANITVDANAAASTGSVSKVEFFTGSTKFGEDTTAPYSATWTNAGSGTHQLTAKVTDSNNFTATSAAVTVIVNSSPTVNITSPTNGQSFAAPANVAITIVAADSDGTVSKVEIYQGATLLGEATWGVNSLYFNWMNVAAGNYSLTAKATDNRGAVTTSAPVNVNVNAAPAVAITAPANNTTFPAGSNVQFTASASDADGSISKVEIYQGTTLLGQAASGINYIYSWNNVAAGTYTITAKATDDRGAVTTSAPITVTVSDPVPPGSVIFGDDFNDNTIDPTKWTVVDPNSPAVVSETGQRLQIALPPNQAAYNGIASNSAYDLRGRSVQLELAQSISQGGWVENYLQVILDSQNYYLINVGAGSMLFRSMTNGANDQTVIGFDQSNARYWRIRHDAAVNAINFETSANGVSWTTQKTVTPGFSLAAVKFNLMSGAWGTGNATPGTAKYDNFQLFNNGPDSSLIIFNGGFEIPRLTAGAFQYTPTGSVWAWNTGGGISSNGSPFTNGNPPAPEGTQVAVLQGDTASVSQSIDGFKAGTQYTISFSAAQRANCCGAGGADFQVFLDNNVLATIRPTSTSYATYSTTVLGVTAGAHTLKFAGLNSSGGDNTAFIDNVRVIAGGPSPSLFDDFNAGTLDTTKWSVADPNSPAVVSQQGQQLRITLPPSTAAYNGIVSNSTYDMRGKMMQVEVAQTVSQAGWTENFVQVIADPQNYFLINTGAGTMVLRSMVNGASDQTGINYDQEAYPYWRIRHDATTNTVNFETSSNGVYWNTRKKVNVGFSLAAVKFALYAGAWGTGNATPGAAKYDNFQLLDSSSARVNVALATNGGAATLSSLYAANYPASAAINGDRFRLNSPDGSYNMAHSAVGAPKPDWVQVNFNGAKTIDEIDVVTVQDNFSSPVIPTEATTFTTYGITAFEVQYWNGSAWATVPGGSVTGNNKVWRKFTFSPIVTTKVRVLVSASVDNLTRIMELEAWSTGGTSQTSAAFVQTDSTTQGNWIGNYGSSGYDLASTNSDVYSLPSYAEISMTGQTPFQWALASSDVRALQKPSPLKGRMVYCWYAATNFTIDLNLSDQQQHQIALYALDWDSNNTRVARFEVIDAATNAVLDTRDLASYTNGKYMVWNLKGHVLLRVTNLPGGANATISGLFID